MDNRTVSRNIALLTLVLAVAPVMGMHNHHNGGLSEDEAFQRALQMSLGATAPGHGHANADLGEDEALERAIRESQEEADRALAEKLQRQLQADANEQPAAPDPMPRVAPIPAQPAHAQPIPSALARFASDARRHEVNRVKVADDLAALRREKSRGFHGGDSVAHQAGFGGRITQPVRRDDDDGDGPCTAPRRPVHAAAIPVVTLNSAAQQRSGECGPYALCNLAAVAQSFDPQRRIIRYDAGRCSGLFRSSCQGVSACTQGCGPTEPLHPGAGFCNHQLMDRPGCIADTIGLNNVVLVGSTEDARHIHLLGARIGRNKCGSAGLERHVHNMLIRPHREPANFLIALRQLGHWVAASAIPAADGSWTIYYLDSGNCAPAQHPEAAEALNVVKRIIANA